MLNPKPPKEDKQSLFSLQIPMKKSYIWAEIFPEDSTASRPLKTNRSNRNDKSTELRKSRIQGSNIFYPGPNFLAKKLKRIVNFHLGLAFHKVKSYRKIIINFNLIQRIPERNLACGFFCIKNYAQLHKGDKLQKVISRNKKPHLLFQAVIGVARRKKRNFFEKMMKQSEKRRQMQSFIQTLENIIKDELKQYYKKVIMRKLINNYWEHNKKMEGVCKVFTSIPKINRRNKSYTFKKLIEGIKTKEYENVSSAKKIVSQRFTESSVQKAKALTMQREKLRNMKTSLELFSSDTSKARYEIRRDLNTYRNKIRDQEKLAKKRIEQLTIEGQNLQVKLQQVRKLLGKRNFRLQLPVNSQTVEEIYKSLWSENPNEAGQIKPKFLTKKALIGFDQQILRLQEFHAYKNQKLRQQIMQYQNSDVFSKRWPQEELINEENKCLKAVIKCLISRALDKIIHPHKEQQHL